MIRSNIQVFQTSLAIQFIIGLSEPDWNKFYSIAEQEAVFWFTKL